MDFKKTVTSALVAGVAAVSLTGCGGSGTSSDNGNSTDATAGSTDKASQTYYGRSSGGSPVILTVAGTSITYTTCHDHTKLTGVGQLNASKNMVTWDGQDYDFKGTYDVKWNKSGLSVVGDFMDYDYYVDKDKGWDDLNTAGIDCFKTN